MDKNRMIELSCIDANNHGCPGTRAIIEIIAPRVGVVIGGNSCSLCGDGTSPLTAGKKVSLPKKFLTWDVAASMKSQDIRDIQDISIQGETKCTPELLRQYYLDE